MLSRPAPKLIRMLFYNPFFLLKIYVVPITKNNTYQKKNLSAFFLSHKHHHHIFIYFFSLFGHKSFLLPRLHAHTLWHTHTIRYVTFATFFLFQRICIFLSNQTLDDDDYFFLSRFFFFFKTMFVHFVYTTESSAQRALQHIPCTYARSIGAIFDWTRMKGTDK